MSDIDPVDPGKISPHQQPINPQAPSPQPIEPQSKEKWDALDKFFGTPLTEKQKQQFKNNMLKMIQIEIGRMQKKAKEAAKHMKDVIEGRE